MFLPKDFATEWLTLDLCGLLDHPCLPLLWHQPCSHSTSKTAYWLVKWHSHMNSIAFIECLHGGGGWEISIDQDSPAPTRSLLSGEIDIMKCTQLFQTVTLLERKWSRTMGITEAQGSELWPKCRIERAVTVTERSEERELHAEETAGAKGLRQ